MLDNHNSKFEQIRQAIADGDKDLAIKMLSQSCSPSDPLHDSLLLLETRLSNLEQSVIEGVISVENENLERNGISKALLSLVKTLESRGEEHVPVSATEAAFDSHKKTPSPEGKTTERNSSSPYKFDTRKWAIAAGLLFTIAVSWAIMSWVSNKGPLEFHDLSIQLTVLPLDLPIGPLGKAQIKIGGFTSELVSVPSNGTVEFHNVPVSKPDVPVKLLLPDLKYKHDILLQNVGAKNELPAQIVLKTIKLSGKVLYPNMQPAPNVELVLEEGLAQATTDPGGNFLFTLPDWGATEVHLTLRRGGKVLEDRVVGLDPDVFKELKIQY